MYSCFLLHIHIPSACIQHDIVFFLCLAVHIVYSCCIESLGSRHTEVVDLSFEAPVSKKDWPVGKFLDMAGISIISMYMWCEISVSRNFKAVVGCLAQYWYIYNRTFDITSYITLID